MAANTGFLAGRTLFITGASRGIGKAIALKAASDGANIVIAAKTAQSHPKLPGTIYSAAKEVEEAGGKALPCIVDIRDEKAVNEAVEQAVSTFGGIDILINNASAISLTGLESTDMKKYDLMNQINARGTYLCSRACLPYLKKGVNPHILTLSPPLNLNPKWFQNHVAYTMAKYGMSMITLGLAEELKQYKIAVNSLWPRTAIYTAAMEMLGGGSSIKKECRKVEIMSDSAYVILCQPSTSYTGKFCIDDTVLTEHGVKDFDQYLFEKGQKLMPDFFLEPNMESTNDSKETSTPDASQVEKTFNSIKNLLNMDVIQSIGAIYQFHLTGSESGDWWLDLKNGSGSMGKGTSSDNANTTMKMKSEDFVKMFQGNLKPTMAFMTGKLKIEGDLAMAMKLEKLMKKMNEKSKL